MEETTAQRPVEHVDASGRQISVGSHIAYAVRKGDSAAMKFGRVVALKDVPAVRHVFEPGGTHARKEYRHGTLRIHSVESGWVWDVYPGKNGEKPVGHDGLVLAARGNKPMLVTLGLFERVLVVSREQIHPEALAALGAVST